MLCSRGKTKGGGEMATPKKKKFKERERGEEDLSTLWEKCEKLRLD